MAKLDWSKGGLYQLDPAREQRVNDFVQPDPRPVVRNLTNEKIKRRAEAKRLAQMRAENATKVAQAAVAPPAKPSGNRTEHSAGRMAAEAAWERLASLIAEEQARLD